MKLIKVLLVSLLFSSLVQASDLHLMELDELSVDYKHFAVLNDKARNLLTYPEHPKEAINVNINSSILGVVYFNNQIQSMTTGAQYKSIGLQVGLGVRLTSYLEVGYLHLSQHVIDGKHPFMKYPVEDSLTVKLYFYRAHKPNNTLF